MPKTVEKQAPQVDATQATKTAYSQRDHAESLTPKRGQSWVKDARKALEAVYYWCVDAESGADEYLKHTDGTWTLWGHQQMQQFLDYTGNSELVKKGKRLVEVPGSGLDLWRRLNI